MSQKTERLLVFLHTILFMIFENLTIRTTTNHNIIYQQSATIPTPVMSCYLGVVPSSPKKWMDFLCEKIIANSSNKERNRKGIRRSLNDGKNWSNY